MKQSVAGVSPSETGEVTVMVVWPSVAATSWGRFWGRRFGSQIGFHVYGIPFTVGRLWMLISIPFILPLYFHMLVPRIPFVVAGMENTACRRYRLTNRRVLIEHGLGGAIYRSAALDRFDTVQIEVLSGQEAYPAGDLVFRAGQIETLRLPGVSRPEAFRQACLKAHQAYVGIRQVRSP